MSELINEVLPVLVQPSVATAFGLKKAIILQIIHSLAKEQSASWVQGSYKQWQELLPFLSIATVKRIFLELEKSKVIVSAQLDQETGNNAKSYRINYDIFDLKMMKP